MTSDGDGIFIFQEGDNAFRVGIFVSISFGLAHVPRAHMGV